MAPILRRTTAGRKSAATTPRKPRWGRQLCLVVAAAALAPHAAPAQAPGDSASTLLATAQQLASRGDTAEALETLARAVRRFPGLAEAHYRRGLLLSRTASASLGDHFHRLSAQRALERALQIDRDNPTYLLELGRLRLKMPFLRLEAGRAFRRALAAARARNDPAVLAAVECELGELSLRRADNARDRRILTGGAVRFDPERALDDWRYAENFITQQSTAVEEPGEADRRNAEDHFRAALSAWPAHEGAAGGLLALLHDAERFEEYRTAAGNFARAAPRSARAQLAFGLGLVRLGRDAEAAAAFDSALALMTPAERRAVEDLSPILLRADARAYQNLPTADRSEAERIYWTSNDPLRLTAVNEHRLEHLARVAYADIRYTAPDLGLRGWETDRGVIYIRYGPPPVAASFPANTEAVGDPEQIGKITTVWWYPERRLRFVFYGTPGYNFARFAGDFAAYAEDARYAAPVRYDNVPVHEALDSVPVQVARFRDSTGATAVVFFAGVPVSRMLSGVELARSALETGLFVSDRLERAVVERRSRESVDIAAERQLESRTFEVLLESGDYRFRVEAREPSSRRAARGAGSLSVSRMGEHGLELSDLLLANRIAPRVEPTRGRHDYFVEPNPAMDYRPGQPVHLYWEIYGLAPDSSGVASYDVSVTIRLEAIQRRGMVARIVGNALDITGVTPEGEDRIVLTYARESSVAGRDRVPETLQLDLGGNTEGLYTLDLRVRDRRSGQVAERSRTFTVSRGTPPQ